MAMITRHGYWLMMVSLELYKHFNIFKQFRQPLGYAEDQLNIWKSN